MAGTILCIDGEEGLLGDLESRLGVPLSRYGFEVIGCLDTSMAWRFIRKEAVALVLLARKLANEDSLHFARRLQDSGYEIPLIFFSNEAITDDIVLGLRYSDDYMAAPLHIDEVIARILAVLRRYKRELASEVVRYKELALNTRTKELSIESLEIPLSPLESRLMQCFMQNGGKILTRDFLLKHVWESQTPCNENSVNVAIRRLRKKVDRGIEIVAIRGEGYKLC